MTSNLIAEPQPRAPLRREARVRSGEVFSEGPTAERIVALDGLRAIAILVVLAHNVGSAEGSLGGIALRIWIIIVNAGWAGVQLFFALSGFLITRILLNSKGADGWLRSFYARRLLRIFPLYYTLLALVFFVAPHVDSLTVLGVRGTRSTLWYWAYLSNWVSPFGGNSNALPHVWSLAVEEQFYLVWPLLVAVVSERVLARICIAMVVGALVVRAGVHVVFPPEIASAAAYELTLARCDALAMGALVALVVRDERLTSFLRAHFFVAFIGLATALATVTAIGRGLPARGLLTEMISQPLTALCSALLVFGCFARPSDDRKAAYVQTTMVRWLSARWLTMIGAYSYAIYVFHRPVHTILRPLFAASLAAGGPDGRFIVTATYTAAVLGISMIIARVSWRVLEQPFLSLKRYFPMPARGARSEPTPLVEAVRG